jgi:hypothetical protein
VGAVMSDYIGDDWQIVVGLFTFVLLLIALGWMFRAGTTNQLLKGTNLVEKENEI